MLQFRFSKIFSFAITLVLAVFLSYSGGDGNEGEELQSTPGLDGLALENRIDIEYSFVLSGTTSNGDAIKTAIDAGSYEKVGGDVTLIDSKF